MNDVASDNRHSLAERCRAYACSCNLCEYNTRLYHSSEPSLPKQALGSKALVLLFLSLRLLRKQFGRGALRASPAGFFWSFGFLLSCLGSPTKQPSPPAGTLVLQAPAAWCCQDRDHAMVRVMGGGGEGWWRGIRCGGWGKGAVGRWEGIRRKG